VTTQDDAARALAGRTGSSFYAAMCLLPASRRDAIYAIYDFCRAVDDIADGPLPALAKREGLERWRADIARLFDARARESQGDQPIVRALATAVTGYGLEHADLLAVIDGVAMDAEGTMRAPSRASLDRYIDGVACAVGRLAVRVFGCPRAEGLALAAALGRALQLTNILRDLDQDAKEGRLYLPRDLLEAHGIGLDDPETVLRHPALPAACAALAAEARDAFAAADATLHRCPRRQVRPAALMAAVYRHLLARLEARGWTELDRPVRVPRVVKAWLAIRHGIF